MDKIALKDVTRANGIPANEGAHFTRRAIAGGLESALDRVEAAGPGGQRRGLLTPPGTRGPPG